VRRDVAPHRGEFLRLLATISLGFSVAGVLLAVPAVVGVPLAFAVRLMASRDLDRMGAASWTRGDARRRIRLSSGLKSPCSSALRRRSSASSCGSAAAQSCGNSCKPPSANGTRREGGTAPPYGSARITGCKRGTFAFARPGSPGRRLRGQDRGTEGACCWRCTTLDGPPSARAPPGGRGQFAERPVARKPCPRRAALRAAAASGWAPLPLRRLDRGPEATTP
jgi:hypothetical protein